MLQAPRTRTNLILIAALVAALIALLVGLVMVTFDPQPTSANAEQARIDAATAAARAEVNALFGVDYQHLDTWQSTVTNGATGDFLKQLQAKLETNKAAVYQSKIKATVNVIDVGINLLKPPDATTPDWTAIVFASADERETSPTVKGIPAAGACPANTICHQYVLKLSVVQTSGGWKVSSLGVAA